MVNHANYSKQRYANNKVSFKSRSITNHKRGYFMMKKINSYERYKNDIIIRCMFLII